MRRLPVDNDLAPLRRDNRDPPEEGTGESTPAKEPIEEHRERCDLGVRLVPDRHIQGRALEHVPRDFRGADDDEEVLVPWNPFEGGVERLAVHREVDDRSTPLVDHAAPRNASFDFEGPAELRDDASDGALQYWVPSRDKDTVRAERAGCKRDVGRDATIPYGPMAQPQDRDHPFHNIE